MDNYGYKFISLSDEELERFYRADLENPHLDLVENQYGVILDCNGKTVDKVVMHGGNIERIHWRPIETTAIGKLRPRNLEQEFAFDMLQSAQSKIKILTGRFGSGKSYCMIAHAFHALEQGKIQKIVFVRNNQVVAHTNELGYLPGSEREKLSPWLSPMADHLGGWDALNDYLDKGLIEPVHLGYMRGRDIKNSIIYCTEGQNLSEEHARLLVSRVGEGSQLWLEGDVHAQVDKTIFEKNSGIRLMIDRLSGQELFANVHLKKSERSATAALADLLD